MLQYFEHFFPVVWLPFTSTLSLTNSGCATAASDFTETLCEKHKTLLQEEITFL